MLLVPKKRNSALDLFDEFFSDPFFTQNNVSTSSLMKTDIEEKANNYLLTMDVPGFTKEDIKMELNNGYLSIMAEKKEENNKQDKEGNYIQKERYYGSAVRKFYVGNNISEDDIKANYENGILKVTIPRKKEELPEKKYIAIE